MATTTYRTIEPEFLELYREEVISEYWDDQSITMYGVIGEAEWAYLDLDHPEVEKTVESITLPVESRSGIVGVIYSEGDYIRRAKLHVSGELDTPSRAIVGSIFVNEGDQSWKTEYYDDEGDMFTGSIESRRISKISTRARGYEFRFSLKLGDLFPDDPGKCVVTIPTIKFRMRGR